MVSGFLTSPCDHCRMSSAVARPIRSSSKKLTSSTLLTSPLLSYAVPRSRAPGRTRERRPGDPLARPLRHCSAHAGTGRCRAPPCAEDVLVGVTHLNGHTIAGQHLDVEAQRLHLLDQHLEG